MTPDDLRVVLVDVAVSAARIGVLPDEAEAGPPAGPIFWPTDGRSSGVVADWVTPVAQRWAPALDLEPRELARILAQGLTDQPSIFAVEVTPTGLLAITLQDEARAAIIHRVIAEEDSYALGRRVDPTDPPAVPHLVEGPGQRSAEDPIRCVQLAHARLSRLIRNAEAVGVEIRDTDRLEVLHHVTDRHLLVALADLPQRLAKHEGDETQRVRALTDLAQRADAWDHPLRPAHEGDPVLPVHGARLALATAARIVLRNGLARLGAAAPERM